MRGLLLVALASLAAGPAAADRAIYTDALAAGWDDWSYSTSVVFANPAPVHGGAASIAVAYGTGYAGLSFRTSPPLDASAYTAIRFWIYGAAGGTAVSVYTQPTDSGAESPSYPVSAPAGVWTEVVVPLAALGSPAQIARVSLQDATGAAAPIFWIDDVSLVEGSGGGFPDPVADRVLGQAGFASSGAGTTASTLNGPAAVAVAPNGRLFVVDFENSRVLSWPDAAGAASGSAADLVLGQAGFTSGAPGATNDRLDHPEGVTVDPQGNVFVADTYNHRVVVYRPPLATGMSGTPFGSQDCGNEPALDEFCYPRALASDTAGNVYLADEFHGRIAIYQTPVASGDYVPDRELFGLGDPRGVAVDAAGNVYATDSEGDRVLEYDAPLVGDTTADRSFGVGPDGFNCFTQTNGAGVTASTLACPIDLAVDGGGNLFVSDLYDHRVLAFADPLASDAVADAVYGQQGSFTSGAANSGGRSATSVSTPLGIAFDAEGNLFLADFGNNRVLAFDAPVPEPGALASGLAGVGALLAVLRRKRSLRDPG